MSSESPADSIDNDEEESARLDLPSSSLTLDSSVLMAHKDMAPHTKGRTNHVQTSAESPKENGMKRGKNNNDNVLTTIVCVNESIQRQRSATEQRLGPPASFGILFCTFYSLLELCGSV